MRNQVFRLPPPTVVLKVYAGCFYRKLFMGLPLPKIKIRNKTYYIDKRLSEIRNVKNPHDAETVSPEVIAYWLKHKIKKL